MFLIWDNRWALVRVSNNYSGAIAHIEESWQEIFPNRPLEHEFLDQNFADSYEDDQVRGNLFLGFSGLMIVIAALGLLGLASFTAEQRSKEISIRKVLGASVSGLISLLVREFVWLVVFGAIPAFGLAYMFAQDWLKNFEFHVEVRIVLFILVTLIILLVTMLTTGFHAFRAAQANPSQNLRND